MPDREFYPLHFQNGKLLTFPLTCYLLCSIFKFKFKLYTRLPGSRDKFDCPRSCLQCTLTLQPHSLICPSTTQSALPKLRDSNHSVGKGELRMTNDESFKRINSWRHRCPMGVEWCYFRGVGEVLSVVPHAGGMCSSREHQRIKTIFTVLSISYLIT